MTPTVSVLMITYKHERFIAQAIESVLSQQTTFNYELVIADDCSPGATPEIVSSFIATHPKGNLIKYYRHEQNIGMNPNGLFSLSKAQGKYIAFCEGDDYWTHPLKLQKQVDFLEKEMKFSGIFHKVDIFIQSEHRRVEANKVNNSRQIFTLELFLSKFFLHTCSLLFRNPNYFPNWVFSYSFGDYPMSLYLLTLGDFYYDNTVMACYRIHSTSVTNAVQTNLSKQLDEKLCLLSDLDGFTNNRYCREIQLAKSRWKIEYQFFRALRIGGIGKYYFFLKHFIYSKDIFRPSTYKAYFGTFFPGLYKKMYELKSRLK